MKKQSIAPDPKNHILIVDDSAVDAEFIVDLLRTSGKLIFEHNHVETFPELDSALKERDWDLILCDFVMSALSPMDAISYAKQVQPTTPIILLSARATVQNAVDMMRLGARGFIDKMDHARLIELAKQELASSRLLKMARENERALQLSALRYQSLVEIQTELICRLDDDFRFTFVNRAVCQWRGLPEQAIVGTNFLDTLPVDQRDKVVARLKALTTNSPATRRQAPLIFPDNSQRWFEWTDIAIFDDDGLFIEYQLVGRDITEHKLYEEALRRSEAKFSTVFAASPDAIVITDGQTGRFIDVNNAFLEGSGYSREEFVGHATPELDIWANADERDQWIQQLAAHHQVKNMEAQFRSKSGAIRHALLSTEIIDLEGRPCLLSIIKDITDRKQIEQALRRSEEKYRSLIESSEASISMLDHNGVYLYHNRVAALPVGVAPQALLGKTVYDLYAPADADRIMADVRYVIESGSGIVVEPEISHAGETHWFRSSIQPVKDDGGKVYAALVQATEVTDNKRAELALQQNFEQKQAILQTIPDIVFRATADGTFLDYHKPYGNSLARPPEDFIGQKIQDVMISESAERLIAGIRETLATQQPVQFDSMANYWGQECEFNTRLVPIGADTVQAIVRDETEQKEAERALIASERRYRQLFELHGLPRLIIDPATGKIVDANLAAGQFYGGDAVTLKTLTIFDLSLEPVDETQDRMVQLADLMSKRVFVHRGLDDKRHDVELHFGPVDTDRQSLLYLVVIDITERRRAEKELQEAHAWLEQRVVERTAELELEKNRVEAIFNHSGDAIVLVNVETGIQQANYAFFPLFNRPPDDYVGLPLTVLVRPEDAIETEACIRQVVASSQARQIDVQIRRDDGITTEVEINIAPIRYSEGPISNVVCIIRDVQAQHAAMRAIAEERNLLRTLIDAVPDFIYVKDLEHRMILNNMAHVRSVGLSAPAQMLGKTDFDMFPHDLATKFYADEEQIFQTARALVDVEERTLNTAGDEIWVLTSKVPLRNLNNVIVGLVGITRDISRIKADEAAIRESEERFRLFTESAPIATIITELSGIIVLVNKQAEALFGYARGELVGQSIAVLIPENARDGQKEHIFTIVTARQSRQKQALAELTLRKDGSVFPADIQLSYIDTRPTPMVIYLALDATQQKQIEAALKQALAQEKELGELKTRFVSTTSHEFRTPLAIILAATETLSAYYDRMERSQIDARLEKIRQQIARLTVMMDDVLQLTRLQSGRVEFNRELGDFDVLCKDVIADFSDHPQHQGRLIYTCARQPVPASFDSRLMQQVISNLVSNALKYSAQEKQVYIELRHDDSGVTLKIQDEGIGITPEDLKRLFEPFHRGSNVGTISGTGLGLSITKQAVELNSGTIVAESIIGTGTTFTITIPKISVAFNSVEASLPG